MLHNRAVLRLFFINWAIGIGLGCVFASALLWADIGHLRSLIMSSDFAIPALLLLYGGFAITSGGVVCGSAIMRMSADEDGSGGGLAEAAEPLPVLVAARRDR